MTRIAFFLNFPLDYKGGINYFRNLLYAIKKYPATPHQVFLFVPNDLSEEYIQFFAPYVQIIKTSILRRKALTWFLDKVCEKTLNYNPLMNILLRKYKVDVVSHSNFVSPHVKTINWIPDFQYVHYPTLWNGLRLRQTRNLHHRLIRKSDMVILSSYAALDDFKEGYSAFENKVHILHFVSQPDKGSTFELSDQNKKVLLSTYSIDRPFFYLPNQFWVHKNHRVVFQAVKILKDKGLEPLLVTSGFMSDSRNKNEHVEELIKFVTDHALQSNILLLGLIPYSDVIKLIIASSCLINPSYFEGWSSTVEEAKTLGKRLILSNIKVHLEQNPHLGIYFNPDDAVVLSEIMERIIGNDYREERTNKESLLQNLDDRTKTFAHSYLSLVNMTVG